MGDEEGRCGCRCRCRYNKKCRRGRGGGENKSALIKYVLANGRPGLLASFGEQAGRKETDGNAMRRGKKKCEGGVQGSRKTPREQEEELEDNLRMGKKWAELTDNSRFCLGLDVRSTVRRKEDV